MHHPLDVLDAAKVRDDKLDKLFWRDSLASQTYGARLVGQLAPRPLLVVHGKADTRLPYTCGLQIYDWAQEPKQLVLYDGAEHRLDECAEDLDELLTQWIPATLRASVSP